MTGSIQQRWAKAADVVGPVIAPVLESVETQLLGRRGVSFAIAAKRTNWQPEDATRVCWRCAGSIGPHESDGDGCASCRTIKLPWDRAIRMGRHEGILRDAVIDLKFRRWGKSGIQLGRALGTELGERFSAASINPSEALLVPVPMTHRRRIARGIDHTMVLVRGASQTSGVGIAPLLRARHRTEQVGLSATDRAKNMRGAFYTRGGDIRTGKVRAGLLTPKKNALDGKRALIVLDDVRTTGSTLGEACRVLRRGLMDLSGGRGLEIWAASIGVAGDERKGGVPGEVEF